MSVCKATYCGRECDGEYCSPACQNNHSILLSDEYWNQYDPSWVEVDEPSHSFASRKRSS